MGAIGYGLILTRGLGPLPRAIDAIVGGCLVILAFLVPALGIAKILRDTTSLQAVRPWKVMFLTFMLFALVTVAVHGFLNALLTNGA